jgi:hypothetical protein
LIGFGIPAVAAGWVLLIGEDAELARVVVALLVSVAYFALHFAVKPFRHPEDGALMIFAEQSLILIYICVLLIKSCDVSSDVCRMYGFGNTARGIYVFFVFFALSILCALLTVGAARLCTDAHFETMALE